MNNKRSIRSKYEHVINNNTFFYFDKNFEEKYEGEINSLTETLLSFKNDIDNHGLKKEILEKLLKEKSNGLNAILALTGISNETFKRIITLIRVVNDKELSDLALKEKWTEEKKIKDVKEWTDQHITKLVDTNPYFVKGLVNLFFEGSSCPFLARSLPLFELKKLSITKIKFEIRGILDTLVRYKSKGSYSAKQDNNPETLIREILNELKVPFTSGDLPKLKTDESTLKRFMDFIIPDKEDPRIIIECTFLSTTSSGQGDKAKVEVVMSDRIKKYYPKAAFIGFVDGIGWFVRKNDLCRMVEAYEEVFTFCDDDIIRFKELVVMRLK